MNEKLPVLFIGHGSPMNAILDNSFTQSLKALAQKITKPKAIMVISAHWQTKGTQVTCENEPRQIYDFYGFPDELYKVIYRPKGSGDYAEGVVKELSKENVHCDRAWGLDHGSWAVLKHMYPAADVPVFQMSLNDLGDEEYHYNMGRKLSFLREKGILIIGSGNIVHNLGRMNYDRNSEPFDWAVQFDDYIAEAITNRKHQEIMEYKKEGSSAKLSVPTNEHFLPLLYIAGLQEESDQVEFIYEGIQHGSMSMRCIRIG